MLTIVLVVFIIISFSKPQVMVGKKIAEKATEAEINQMASAYRKIYLTLVLMLEGLFSTAQGIVVIGLPLLIAGIVVGVVFKVFTTSKENKALVKEIKERTAAPETVEESNEAVAAE